ncbi:hypothetical protein [Glycomyces harbinensis]|uniref:hypothetical protein n=1 Tax=Glycomyces harbinensis TaxID=58114 RepID=UPI000B8884C5|nr:hypothetical protein [Glycomyces harbinensis]
MIVRLRREGGMIMGSAVVIWLLLLMPAVSGNRIVNEPAIAALAAPMVIAALFYGAESRRLARGDRRRTGARPILRFGQIACVAMLVAATADLLWQWGGIDPTSRVTTAVILVTAVLTYFGYFHRRVASADSGGFRLARTSLHRALTVKGRVS